MDRKVVITGLGMITPMGLDVESSWGNLCKGKSGISIISRFDSKDFTSKIAGEVKGFDSTSCILPKEIKKMDMFIQYAVYAANMAFNDSGLELNETNAERAGVIIGVGLGGLPAIEKYGSILEKRGPKKITPFFIPMVIGNLASGQVSIRLGAKGPNICTQTACASGSHAIGDAYKLIQHGKADIMIAGGAESVITPLAVGGFCAMKALSCKNDEPTRASRPFDKERDGFIMGEGSGVLILEEFNHAKRRGAKIYGEVAGYGMSSDAYHITSPSPGGEGAARCMTNALQDGNIPCEKIDYINAHGTSTPHGDEIETAAIKKVFKDHAYKLSVSSTKSMMGHLLGAAGGVEAIVSLMTLNRGIIPPTINYENPDSECDLDYVPNVQKELDVKYSLSNSFGFGGTNAALIFKKVD